MSRVCICGHLRGCHNGDRGGCYTEKCGCREFQEETEPKQQSQLEGLQPLLDRIKREGYEEGLHSGYAQGYAQGERDFKPRVTPVIMVQKHYPTLASSHPYSCSTLSRFRFECAELPPIERSVLFIDGSSVTVPLRGSIEIWWEDKGE